MDKAAFDLVKELQQIRIDIQNNQRRLEDTITESLPLVDSLRQSLDEEFDLTTAVSLCKAGYFVQHVQFSNNESMHYYDGKLYFEDGTSVNVQYLQEQELFDHWRVKKNPLEIDLIKLRNLHAIAEESILEGSFEECFK